MADNKRAAPRKAKKTTDEAPIFLEKSFQMVETVRMCDRPLVRLRTVKE